MTEQNLKDDIQKIMEENGIPDDAWNFLYKESVVLDFRFSSKKVKDDLTRLFSRYKKLSSTVFESA